MPTRPIDPEDTQTAADAAPARKPRLAIMGEFSAGKSTLTNLLLGAPSLPVKVTATQLPPVWLSHGTAPVQRIDLDTRAHEMDPSDIDTIPLNETQVIRAFTPVPFLERWDIIDFPGISDPNMDPAVWERIVPLADAVLWCTHATQAWRQSEAAVWEELAPRLASSAILLLTRIDGIEDPADRQRVLTRVTRETEGLFTVRLPVSLLEATEAGSDVAAWRASGAETLWAELERLERGLPLTGTADLEPVASPAPKDPSAAPGAKGAPRRVTLRRRTPAKV